VQELKVFLASLFIISAILISGCGGRNPPQPDGGIVAPDWFLTPPEDPNYMYAIATSTSKDMQMAINSAKEDARVSIARQLETKINSMFKRFREEVGVGEDSELLSQTTDVSKSVTSKVLSGTRAAKMKPVKEGMIYRAYVLMEMPIGGANAALLDAVKKQENIYTRFRASQGFQELEEEVDKYDQYKKDQGIAP